MPKSLPSGGKTGSARPLPSSHLDDSRPIAVDVIQESQEDDWIQRTIFGPTTSQRANDSYEYCPTCKDPSCSGECLEPECDCGQPKELLTATPKPSASPELLRSLRSREPVSGSLFMEAIWQDSMDVRAMQGSRPANTTGRGDIGL